MLFGLDPNNFVEQNTDRYTVLEICIFFRILADIDTGRASQCWLKCHQGLLLNNEDRKVLEKETKSFD